MESRTYDCAKCCNGCCFGQDLPSEITATINDINGVCPCLDGTQFRLIRADSLIKPNSFPPVLVGWNNILRKHQATTGVGVYNGIAWAYRYSGFARSYWNDWSVPDFYYEDYMLTPPGLDPVTPDSYPWASTNMAPWQVGSCIGQAYDESYLPGDHYSHSIYPRTDIDILLVCRSYGTGYELQTEVRIYSPALKFIYPFASSPDLTWVPFTINSINYYSPTSGMSCSPFFIEQEFQIPEKFVANILGAGYFIPTYSSIGCTATGNMRITYTE